MEYCWYYAFEKILFLSKSYAYFDILFHNYVFSSYWHLILDTPRKKYDTSVNYFNHFRKNNLDQLEIQF